MTYNYQAWSENTYKIELRKDILSTGMYSDSSYVEDFYTISANSLNISGFIKSKKINKEVNKADINIKINSFDYYKDYTICNMQVFNHTDNDILISSLENSKDIVLVDSNDNEYEFYDNELNESNCKINKNELKEISIKFNLCYRKDLYIKKVKLNNIIFNYQHYQEGQFTDEDKTKVTVEL